MRIPLRRVSLLTFLLVSFTVNRLGAQSTNPRFGVEASVAASIPVGKYAKKGYSSMFIDAVYQNAKVGLAADIRPSYYFNKQASVFLQLGISMNASDEEAMEEGLEQGGGINQVTAEVDRDGWLLWKIMPGFAYSFELGEGISIRPSVAAGVLFTKQPKITATVVVGGPMDPLPPQITQFTMAEKELPTAFAYQLGATASFSILKDVIYINANLHYFDAYSNDKFTYTPIFPTPSDPVTIEHKYRFGSVNIGAGIEFRF